MPIKQVSTSNTFLQWLESTQSLIDKSNYYEVTTNNVFSNANVVISLSTDVNAKSISINSQSTYINTKSNSINSVSNSVNSQTAIVISTTTDIKNYVNSAYDTANSILSITANITTPIITDNNSIDANYYPLLSANLSGYLLKTNVASQKIFFNPYLGRLTLPQINVNTIIISSTGAITNLNADLLDGQHGSYYSPLTSPAFSGTPTGPTAAVDTNTTQFATTGFVIGQASGTTPLMDGTSAVGSSTRYARQDHVHPSDTSRASLTSPAFSGIPTGPTATVDTNTTQLATTGFVIGQASGVVPLMDGIASFGSSFKYARQDHVHPSDTTKANLNGAAFSGGISSSGQVVSTNSFYTYNYGGNPAKGVMFFGNQGSFIHSEGYDFTMYMGGLADSAIINKAGTVAMVEDFKTINGENIVGTGDIAISTKQLQSVSASVASNALTLTLNPTTLDFRAATLASGAISTRTIASDISLVVPSGATLGTIAAKAARLVVLAIDNAGTVELAVTNLNGSPNLDETTLISTTALSTAADSTGVIYSTTARASVPFRVVGFIDITEATAGTWATAPAQVQGGGGQAVAATTGLGVGQVISNFTSSGRSINTTYYNTTGRAILAYIEVDVSTNPIGSGAFNIGIPGGGPPIGSSAWMLLIPPWASYGVSNLLSPTILKWYELR